MLLRILILLNLIWDITVQGKLCQGTSVRIFFPAYAVGWMISNEKFWEPILPVVSELKLKASYGSVGNDAIGGDRWIYQSTISTNNGWNYGENGSEGGGGIQVGNVENLNVSWEKA